MQINFSLYGRTIDLIFSPYLPTSLHLGLSKNSNSVPLMHVIIMSPLSFLLSEQLTDTIVPKLTGKDVFVFRCEMSGGRLEQNSVTDSHYPLFSIIDTIIYFSKCPTMFTKVSFKYCNVVLTKNSAAQNPLHS